MQINYIKLLYILQLTLSQVYCSDHQQTNPCSSYCWTKKEFISNNSTADCVDLTQNLICHLCQSVYLHQSTVSQFPSISLHSASSLQSQGSGHHPLGNNTICPRTFLHRLQKLWRTTQKQPTDPHPVLNHNKHIFFKQLKGLKQAL